MKDMGRDTSMEEMVTTWREGMGFTRKGIVMLEDLTHAVETSYTTLAPHHHQRRHGVGKQ